MKFLLKKRFIVIPLIIIIMVLAIGGIVLAANQIIISGHVNVVQASYDIEAYSDPACTIQLTLPLVWNDLPTGEKRSKTIYIKNIGNSDALVVPTLQSSVTEVTLTPNPITVLKGESAPLILKINATASAPLGSAALTITLTSSQASQANTTPIP